MTFSRLFPPLLLPITDKSPYITEKIPVDLLIGYLNEKRIFEIVDNPKLFWHLFCLVIFEQGDLKRVQRPLMERVSTEFVFRGRSEILAAHQKGVEILRLLFFTAGKNSDCSALCSYGNKCGALAFEGNEGERPDPFIFRLLIAPFISIFFQKLGASISKVVSESVNGQNEQGNKNLVEGFRILCSPAYMSPPFFEQGYSLRKRVFRIFLDIDEFLVCSSTLPQETERGEQTAEERVQTAGFFYRKGAIVTALKTHYVFPGVIEFLRLLFTTEGVRVHFFSKGCEERNAILVKDLLTMAFGEEIGTKIFECTEIFSRNHCVQDKKNLSKLLPEEALLKDAILIDDRFENAAKGEERNFFYAPATTSWTFVQLQEKVDRYDENGTVNVKCVLTYTVDHDIIEKLVAIRKIIFITPVKEEFLCFFWSNRTKTCCKEKISQEQDSELFNRLERVVEASKGRFKEGGFMTRNSSMVSLILAFVASYEGKVKKICRSPNRIYLIAHCLFQSIELARKNNLPLNSQVFGVSYDSISKRAWKSSWMTEDDYYLAGLERLQQINSGLELIHPHSYVQGLKEPMSSEEEKILKKVVRNEFEY